ncbi:MAG: response regulator [Vitreoscilla sp.]|nr:response regulator [Burkholderiales bacterium]MBP6336120.1 response regulator [Vitreoscilla sp.]MBP6673818.1 response regulator [Vitreoscilla sp.]
MPSPTPVDLQTRREALRMAMSGAPGSVPLLWLVVGLMLLPAPALGLDWLVWLLGGVAVASGLWRLHKVRRWRLCTPLTPHDLALAERHVQANAALSGVMWATGTLVLFPLLTPAQATLHFMVQVGSLCMAAFYMSPVRRSFEWIALPMMLPLIGMSLWHPKLLSWPLALGATLLLLALLRATAHLRSTTLLAIRREQEAQAANELLRLAKERVEAETAAKSRFLATMSHEVRTPLSGALGALALLDAEPLNAGQRELLGVAQGAIESLGNTLTHVLAYTRIEAGSGIDIKIGPVALVAMLQALVAEHEPRARAQGLSLQCSLGTTLPPLVLADAPALRQVLGHLLSNALKFTVHGRVGLRVDADAEARGQIHFEVSDTGIGMPSEALDVIFLPFQQWDCGPQRAYSGAGLGLAVAQHLVAQMGGQIQVQSTAGQGSRFSFSLNLPTALATAPVPKPMPAASDLPSAAQRLAGTVLVAEDNAINRLVAVKMLRSAGLAVREARDGEAALRALHEGGISLVLMDGQMPVLDGYAATRQWREHEQRLGKAHLPIVALTANVLEEDADLARTSGMDDVLTKPYQAQELLALVARWMGPRPR